MVLKNVFLVVNVDWFFLSHRLPIAVAAKKNGYVVSIISRDTGRRKEIESYGFRFVDFPLHRGRTNFFSDFFSIFFLFKLYLREKPEIIHHVGLKIIIFGTIACFFSFHRGLLINALSGAGTMFTGSKSKSIIFSLLLKIYNLVNNKNVINIFQNEDDLRLFQSISKKIEIFAIIKGSGVDLKKFKYTEIKPSKPKNILFIGRLLQEKGILEVIDSAKLLYDSHFGEIRFQIIGDIDVFNPTSISKGYIDSNTIENYIEWFGHVDNVIPFIEDSYVVILPSHREGLPKSLIEACSIGRPIVTSDAVGCREVVENSLNGFLVRVGDSKDLANKIEILVRDFELARRMGLESRRKAENEFSQETVINSIIDIYNLKIS